MGKLINRIPGLIASFDIKFTRLGFENKAERHGKPRDSTSPLKALLGKLDTKRHSPKVFSICR